MPERQRGFTLIELLIVIAIISILAIIALPNLVRSRISANEANALGAMKSFGAGLNSFVEDYGICPPWCCFMFPRPPGCECPAPPLCPFPCPFPPPSPVPLPYLSPKQVESIGPDKPWSGYIFRYETGAPVGAGAARACYQATPLVNGGTGVRGFAADLTGAVVTSRDGTDCCTGDGRLSTACTSLN